MYRISKIKLKTNKRFIQSLTAIKLIIICNVLMTNANAIIFRHDIPAEQFVAKESDFPALFAVYDDGKIKDCVATLISPSWALTAAHCTAYLDKSRLSEEPHVVNIAGSTHQIVKLFYPEQFGGYRMVRDSQGRVKDIIASKNINYQYDIALLKLSKPINNIAPIPLYSGYEESGKEVIFLGWGDYSTGELGVDSDNPNNDRQLRLVTNQVDSVNETQLFFDFDDPTTADSDARPLEGISGPGDSGGPALLKTTNGYSVIGISSRGAYSATLSAQPKNTGKYSWLEYYTRVSSFTKWLSSTMSQH